MKTAKRNVFVKAFLFFLLGCLFLQSFSVFAFTRSQYEKSLKKFTRENERYQRKDFHASLKWHATHLHSDYLKIEAEFLKRIYDLSDAEKNNHLSKQIQNSKNKTIFFVSFYSYEFENSDLSAEKSGWKLKLVSGGKSYSPLSIKKIPKSTPLLKKKFPYIDIWSRNYYIEFPKVDAQNHLILKVNGPFGHDDLHWNY